MKNVWKRTVKKVFESIKPDEKVFVLISKIYGLADPVLNMGIPGKLMDMGYKVLSFFELPEGDISAEYPNMFWPFGQHILEPAKLIRKHSNMHAVFLTHHCCGPDSVFTHYFREIMGDKPYLNIEVDEHSSEVGVITRIEAFINSINSVQGSFAVPEPAYGISESINELPAEQSVCLPNIFPYSDIIAAILRKTKRKVEVLPSTTMKSVAEGRKYTMTNELLSLTGLLGDVFHKLQSSLKDVTEHELKETFLIPPIRRRRGRRSVCQTCPL